MAVIYKQSAPSGLQIAGNAIAEALANQNLWNTMRQIYDQNNAAGMAPATQAADTAEFNRGLAEAKQFGAQVADANKGLLDNADYLRSLGMTPEEVQASLSQKTTGPNEMAGGSPATPEMQARWAAQRLRNLATTTAANDQAQQNLDTANVFYGSNPFAGAAPSGVNVAAMVPTLMRLDDQRKRLALQQQETQREQAVKDAAKQAREAYIATRPPEEQAILRAHAVGIPGDVLKLARSEDAFAASDGVIYNKRTGKVIYQKPKDAKFGSASWGTYDTSTGQPAWQKGGGTQVPDSLAPLFDTASAETGVPVGILHGLASVESTFNPGAISPSGAMGVMQLMPDTAKELGVTNPYDPQQNITGGAKYLRQMYDKYGDWPLAFAAYNAGPGKVDNAIKQAGAADFDSIARFLPEETRKYVPKVFASINRPTSANDHGMSTGEKRQYDAAVRILTMNEKWIKDHTNPITGAKPNPKDSPYDQDAQTALGIVRKFNRRDMRGGKTSAPQKRVERTGIPDIDAQIDKFEEMGVPAEEIEKARDEEMAKRKNPASIAPAKFTPEEILAIDQMQFGS